MNYMKKGIKGVFIISFLTLFGNLLGYVTRSILARNLNPSHYGLFYSILSFSMVLLFFSKMGMNTTLVKYVSEFRAKRKFGEMKFVILFSSVLRIISTIFLGILIFIFSKYLADHYFKHTEATAILIIFSIIIIFIMFNRILSNIFNSIHNNLFMGLIEFSQKFFFLFFFLLYIFIGYTTSPLLVTYSYLFSVSIVFIIFIIPAIKQSKILEFKLVYSKKLIKKLTFFSAIAFLGSMTTVILGYIDTIMLTSFRSLAEVGVYNVVLPTVMLLAIFGDALKDVALPMVSELWAKKMKNKLSQGIQIINKYILMIIVPAALVLIIFPKLIINLLFGSQYISGYFSMQLLSIGIVFATVAAPGRVFLWGTGHLKEDTKIVVIAAVFNIITNLLLIPRWGIVGAALTTSLSYMITMILVSFKLKKIANIPFNGYNWLKIFIASITFAAVANFIKNILNINIYIEAIICLIFGGLIYLSICYFFKLIDVKEIKFILKNFFKKSEIHEDSQEI
jgi:O-antigen/teichoic acid export membrane protein